MTTTISKLRDQLLQTVDNAIEKGRWDNSLFLKNILKQLQELREYIIKELVYDFLFQLRNLKMN